MENKILLEISNFCENKCDENQNCVEENCVLFRIERLIHDDRKNARKLQRTSRKNH